MCFWEGWCVWVEFSLCYIPSGSGGGRWEGGARRKVHAIWQSLKSTSRLGSKWVSTLKYGCRNSAHSVCMEFWNWKKACKGHCVCLCVHLGPVRDKFVFTSSLGIYTDHYLHNMNLAAWKEAQGGWGSSFPFCPKYFPLRYPAPLNPGVDTELRVGQSRYPATVTGPGRHIWHKTFSRVLL